MECPAGHGFDIARQGYVTLRTGAAGPGTGDSTAMVAARARFLGGGHYRPLASAIGDLVAQHLAAGLPGAVVDLAGGTGYYLAAVLDALPDRHGICLDLSAPALRRAARAHPRAAAIGADTWQRLPLQDRSAALVLSVFGPRDPDQIERVLAAGGVFVTAAPLPEHLGELVGPLGLIGVDPRKPERQAVAFQRFERRAAVTVRHRLQLRHDAAVALVGMGPSAEHVSAEELAARVATLPDPVEVGVAVEVTCWSPPGPG